MKALVLALATAFIPMQRPGALLHGTMILCGDDERSFEYRDARTGRIDWALHMGPFDEFALFLGPDPEEHREHDSAANLLRPAYRVDDVRPAFGGRNWSAAGLAVNVVPGERPDGCRIFLVLVTKKP